MRRSASSLRGRTARLRAQGWAEGRAGMVRQVLLSRGIEVSEGLLAGLLAGYAEDAIVTAALACESEADFLARLRQRSSRS